ncbi:MAG: CPBP family intramembrane glutamic endopeptidase [Terracidiphilus sp.]
MPAVLFVFSVIMLIYFIRHDLVDYQAFRRLTATKDRQRRYRTWIATGFLLFFLYPLLGLAVLHQITAPIHFPSRFGPAALALRSHLPVGQNITALLAGAGSSVVAGILLGIFLASRRKRPRPPLVLGSVEPLMPRNKAELVHTAALSLNAGLSEEVFFRLFLPLLAIELHVDWLAAFLLAALLFGVTHIYQGPLGVAATTVLGLLFTVVYLASGSLWVAAGLHAGLDLVHLVVRPGIGMYCARRPPTPDDAPPASS